MTKNPKILKQIETIENEIIAWGKLLGKCEPDSTKFEARSGAIEHSIQVRKGLLRFLEEENSDLKECELLKAAEVAHAVIKRFVENAPKHDVMVGKDMQTAFLMLNGVLDKS